MKNLVLIEALDDLKRIASEIEGDDSYSKKIEDIVEILSKTFQKGGKLLLCGNGGSAAECQHMAAEYVATLNSKNMRRSLPAMALTVDTSFITAWSNDFNTHEIFSRQIEGLGKPGDFLIVYSTSGNSKNIIEAVKVSKKLNIFTVALLGNSGGELKDIADLSIVVPSVSTPRIQEIHTLLGHTICRNIELKLGF